MGFFAWLMIGSIVGGFASSIMLRRSQQGIVLTRVVGMVGAVLAVWSMKRARATIHQGMSPGTVLVSLPGAIMLLDR